MAGLHRLLRPRYQNRMLIIHAAVVVGKRKKKERKKKQRAEGKIAPRQTSIASASWVTRCKSGKKKEKKQHNAPHHTTNGRKGKEKSNKLINNCEWKFKG